MYWCILHVFQWKTILLSDSSWKCLLKKRLVGLFLLTSSFMVSPCTTEKELQPFMHEALIYKCKVPSLYRQIGDKEHIITPYDRYWCILLLFNYNYYFEIMKYLDSPAQSKPSQQQHTRTIPAIRLSSVTIGLLITFVKYKRNLELLRENCVNPFKI